MEDFTVKKLSNGDFEIQKPIRYDPGSMKVLQNLEPVRKRPTQHIVPDET